jgi:hypothetical protein
MFRRTKKIEPKISQLEKRVCDLESPYKYEVGEKVLFNDFENLKRVIEGVIVERNCRYKDETINTFFRYVKVEPYYIRENWYKVYVEKKKNTYNVGENELKKQTLCQRINI